MLIGNQVAIDGANNLAASYGTALPVAVAASCPPSAYFAPGVDRLPAGAWLCSGLAGGSSARCPRWTEGFRVVRDVEWRGQASSLFVQVPAQCRTLHPSLSYSFDTCALHTHFNMTNLASSSISMQMMRHLFMHRSDVGVVGKTLQCKPPHILVFECYKT